MQWLRRDIASMVKRPSWVTPRQAEQEFAALFIRDDAIDAAR